MLLGRTGGGGKQGLSPLGPSSGCEARIWAWREGGPGASRPRAGWVSRADGPVGGGGREGLSICVPPVSRRLQLWAPPPTFPFHLCSRRKP